MTTTTQSFANHNLSVDLNEDHMEMATSPYPEPNDNDIDFELDDQREHSVEDNSMIDDTAEDPDTNLTQDDIMYDEEENELLDLDQDLPMDPYESTYVNDEEIEHAHENIDTHPSVPDQQLPGLGTEKVNATQDETLHPKIEDVQVDTYELEEEDTNVGDIHPTEDFEGSKGAKKSEVHADNQESGDGNLQDTTSIVDFAEDVVTQTATEDQTGQPQHDDDRNDPEPSVETTELFDPDIGEESIETVTTEAEDANENLKADLQPDQSGETEESSQREGTPENLHPVTVRYNGEDCWLFPPLDTTDVRHVFLQDVTLASQPFDQLLTAIRPGLINNQEMADHDEIVLNIPALGLYICEDSKHAANATLSKVIDMYMMLSQNEGLTVFEPLFCELSTRVCLADQFAYLEDAAFSRRMTYTDFVAEQAGTPAETAEVGEITATVEEVQTDNTTSYDAAIDENGVGERSASLDVIENTVPEHSEEAGNDDATEIAEPGAEASYLPNEGLEEQISTDTVLPPTAADSNSPPQSPVAHAEASSFDEQQHGAHDDTPRTPNQNGEATAKPSVDVTASPEAEDEDDDEDLFADDDDTTVEPELEEPDLESTIEEQNTETVGVVDATTIDNDEFDFDNWSDDEGKDDKAREAVSKSTATPSKGMNGKRKLIDDDDDFLDIDVSTPEPKRNRSS